LLTEDYYVFNKLAKGLIGTNNIDSNSRLCMSSAVAGYKQTLGSDAPPACYDDVNHAGTIFIVGANPAYAHPVLFRRIEAARQARPDLKIVLCDPRRTDTAEIADLFLPIQPGTDVMLFNGMLHVMLWEGWLDTAYMAAHTNGFEELKATVRDYTPDVVAQTCGISKDDLLQAARLFAGINADGPTQRTRAPTLSLYCQGLNQSSSGTAKNAALINLHLATGQIGKRGAGPFSLTGQPNASADTYSISLAGANKWTLSSSIFTSMVSCGAPGMANSTMSMRRSPSAYATVSGATFIRSTGISAHSFTPSVPFDHHLDAKAQSPASRGEAYLCTGVHVTRRQILPSSGGVSRLVPELRRTAHCPIRGQSG